MIQKEWKVIPGTGIRIKKSGFFDFENLYKDMKDWFIDHEYLFNEKEHTEKDLPQGKEILIKWTAERDIDDYAKFKIDIHWMIERFNKIDKRYKGELKITFFAYVELDYKRIWQKNMFYKFLFFIYNNYIIKRKILTNYDPKLKSDINSVREIAKRYLE